MRVSGNVYIRKRQRQNQYYARWRVEGHQFKRCLGPVWEEKGRPPEGYYTKRKAQEQLQAILTDARRGDPNQPGRKGGEHTFGQACDLWLAYIEHERGRNPSTVRGYRSVVRRYLLEEFGADTPVGDITTEQIDALRERLLTSGTLKRRTVQKTMVMLYGILKRAKRKGWIAANPAEDAERVTLKESGDFNVLSASEVEAVARAADDELDAAIFVVAAFTGLRMGELVALRWQDVDFANAIVFVRRNKPAHSPEKTPKSGKVRSVPLIDRAATALDGLSRRRHFTSPTDLVFCTEVGGHISDGDLRKRFYGALKRAGLGHKRTEDPPMVFHSLRHSFGTLAAQVWPMVDIQAYMGHADIKTTMKYAHHVPKHNAADALNRLVETETAPQLVPAAP